MRFTVLGSGTAVPDPDRGPAGFLVEVDGLAWLVDGGSGTLQRCARAGVDPRKLSGGVYSASVERSLTVARRIRTGTLSINGAQWFDVDTPFGGYGQSGVGRENGVMGFEEYLETKVIGVPAGS